MEERITEIICIIDKSSSMEGEEYRIRREYNTMLSAQQKLPGVANITTVLFNEAMELVYSGDLLQSPEMDGGIYQTDGSTALLDTMYDVINTTVERLESTLGYTMDSGVVCAIFTDGGDNMSTVSVDKLKALIRKCLRRNWQFIFMSDAREAISLATKLGLPKESITALSGKNMGQVFGEISEKATTFRLEQAKKTEEEKKQRAIQEQSTRGIHEDKST